jgi:hypothetical protein
MCVVENEKVKYFQKVSFWTIKILPRTQVLLSIKVLLVLTVSIIICEW